MDETTLMFRHLPVELTKEEKKDLLFSFGASRVHVMGTKGRLKNIAFASFPSKDLATEVLHQLHQADVLGSKLVVEIARHSTHPHTPSLLDADRKSTVVGDGDGKLGGEEDSGKAAKVKVEPREVKFDAAFGVWGLKHPRRPDLKYRYPPPTPSILTNILNALVALPKFYVQVLHLMNKMDLPAPFGTVTPAPPFAPSHMTLSDDIIQKEMEISSSEEESESELESEGESKAANRLQDSKASEDNASRRRRKNLKKKLLDTKRPRLSEFHLNNTSQSENTTSTTNVAIQDVFEQMPQSHGTAGGLHSAKKMAMNLKLSSKEGISPGNILSDFVCNPDLQHLQHVQQQQQQQQQALSSSLLPISSTSSNRIAPSSEHDNSPSLTPTSLHLQHHQQQTNPPSPPSHRPTQPYNSSALPPQPFPQIPPPPPLPSAQVPLPPLVGQASNPDSQTDHLNADDNTVDKPCAATATTTTSRSEGFGTIQHTTKLADVERKEAEISESSSEHSSVGQDRKFISSAALRRGRLTKEEMQDSSVFRRYDAGEASCRLYIKNVAKQATEEDLRHIYGRYLDWDDQTQINMFDIRLMKEGRMKGQAFVTMPSQEVATQALSDTNGFVLKEKPLVVQFARSARAQEDSAAL